MLLEITQSEFYNLFQQPINTMRFSFDELIKAYEARFESLMHNAVENNCNETTLKSFKAEISRAIEGLKIQCACTCDSLKKNLDKSYEKIESSNENRS